MRIKAAIFDLYYTLALEDSNNPFYEAVAIDLGFTLSEFMPPYLKCGKATMRGDLDGMMGRVFEACKSIGRTMEESTVRDVVAKRLELFYDSVSLYPDALSTISRLKAAGLKLG